MTDRLLSRRLLPALVVLAGAAAPAFAQMADNDEARATAILRSGSVPAGADRTFLLKYVSDLAAAMWDRTGVSYTPPFQNGPPGMTAAVELERLRLRAMPFPVGPNTVSSESVLNGFAEIYRDAFLPVMSKEPKNPAAFTQAAFLLADMRAPVLVPTYQKIHQFPHATAGGRARVMWALQALRAQTVTQAPVRAFLVEAAKAETSVAVLYETFAAMDLTGVSGANVNQMSLEMITTALRARLDRYYSGQIAGLGGEVRALQTLESLTGGDAPLIGKNKLELIELLTRLENVAGIRYTEFSKANVHMLRMKCQDVLGMRTGAWETLVLTDRVLVPLLAGTKPAPEKPVLVEEAFAKLMAKDPLESETSSENSQDHLELLRQLLERRNQVNEVLKAAGYKGPANIAEPAPWVESADPKK